MEKNKLFEGFLSGNQLKLIAIIAMTLDHIGVQILPYCLELRIIGRLAFPIFAYMIAEGCKYTKNRKKYLLTMVMMALGCQLIYFIAMGSLYQCVLVTFSLSIALIYILDNARNKSDPVSVILALAAFVGIYILTVILPEVLTKTDFDIDYGLWGVLLPVFVFMADGKLRKLSVAALSLVLLSMSMGEVQWYSLASLVLLALYNGKRGKAKMKNLFYIYYPSHLVVIYLISLLC